MNIYERIARARKTPDIDCLNWTVFFLISLFLLKLLMFGFVMLCHALSCSFIEIIYVSDSLIAGLK